MKRVLVTGGAGFLGCHLCDRLLREGCQVLCVDNFSTGSRWNIRAFLDNPDFEMMRHDVCLPLHVEVDEIYNLACPASPAQYQRDPVQTIKTSVHGAINVLGMARRLGVKVLQASTSEVYGDPAQHPQREDYWGHVNPVGERSCYDEGKRCAESLFLSYQRRHGLPVKIARIFNTYGPWMRADDGRVVSNFIVQALRGRPLTVYGDGAQSRSFCFVSDLIEGLVRLMASDQDLMGPVNLGNPVECDVRSLAELVLQLTGSRSRLVFRPLPGDDPRQRCPDIALAGQSLDWRPEVDLESGLIRTIRYFDEMLAHCAC